ncbi:hypothetical protein PR202_ga18796 [Eleusine coracana subsp. coracana]|uniref:Secreted protein n=1 Tax=Eleusine coracana subsp. coracana TaxID=191504 RepID=A0AAV5CU49_ELECO|nr:hypothetical protein QOZ80_4AG0301540 [Eleusine coracana subsp. coracana]GJN01523.1 hypothetical protein PR202_ga18796 [Eleusine coracana subsp. coracana]
MGFHLLAIAVARGFLQVFHLSAPWLRPLNLWAPSARHLPEACAALYAALASHAAWLRSAYARGTVWSHRRRRRATDDVDEYIRHALLSVSY